MYDCTGYWHVWACFVRLDQGYLLRNSFLEYMYMYLARYSRIYAILSAGHAAARANGLFRRF